MIIGHYLMVKLGLTDKFKHKVLQWDGATVYMKELRGLIGKSDLTKHDMHEVVMQNEEPDSTREATEKMIKTLDINYAKEELKQASDNATQLNAEEITQLLSLLDESEELFDINLGYWATDPVDLDLKPCYKPFNSRYYPFLIINKETFRKELKRIVEI